MTESQVEFLHMIKKELDLARETHYHLSDPNGLMSHFTCHFNANPKALGEKAVNIVFQASTTLQITRMLIKMYEDKIATLQNIIMNDGSRAIARLPLPTLRYAKSEFIG